ncbi:MAG: NADP-dependent phosphogluconate dehydrogenase [Candidatus Baltobacteraceae bacterium]|jgi:6-phosphogluconate dehydrogenase
MATSATFGVTGLAVMGANLARNLAHHGVAVAVHNRTAGKTAEFVARYGSEGTFVPASGVASFVAAIARPRPILIMVKAGRPVDDVIAELLPYLDAGDILIDGGNSYFEDTRRRTFELEAKGFRYIGTGVSGGEEGALNGPSIMPGGSEEAYRLVEPVLTGIAAQVGGAPCCTYIGADGAGHYVKMVHNGIEYADMQLIAEAYDLLRQLLGLEAGEIGDVFARWNDGELDSYLIGITAEVLHKRDEGTGRPLVDLILDEAEQKGTGRWTSASALELGVPLTAITEAVFARALSARKADREDASRILSGPRKRFGGDDRNPRLVDDLQHALYASKIVAYAQGFEQLAAAAAHYDWKLDFGAIASIWRGGCIIRARFLNRISEAYAADPRLKNLLLAPYFSAAIGQAQGPWRRVVAQAVDAGVPVPAFASALAYYDGYRRERSPANLIQGLRDYFGAHTYRRTDAFGSFHTRWAQDGEQVTV